MLAMTRRALSTSALALSAGALTGAGSALAQTRAPAAIGAFGLDLAARDPNAKPGDDFFRYCNGHWVDTTEIPADRSSWGTFAMLREKSDRDVRTIIEEVAAASGAPGSEQQKIADYYGAFLNTDAIEAAGLNAIAADLATINGARTHEDVVRLVNGPELPLATPIGMYITLDKRDPNRFIVAMTHSGISLPDRDYYLSDDPELVQTRTEFLAHVERMLGLARQSNPAGKARDILALETEIARLHWPVEDRRDEDRLYNRRDRAQIRALAPAYPWDAMFDAAELSNIESVIVRELSAMGPLANLVIATPVETWRAYLVYHYLANTASVLPRALDAEAFSLYGHTLNGQPEQQPRWKRGVTAVNGVLGKAVGRLYVARHFPPDSKAQMLALVENMRRAYGERIASLSWMSAETKVAAHEKLATFLPKIGYPDSWRDYSAFEVRAGDALGNLKRSGAYNWRYDVARLGRAVDKTEWLYMDPQEVNAYYNDSFNEVVFPAAILQAPFFDPSADPAVNYGAIGGVIGHEMGHGFDDQGAKSDAYGVMRDWWTAADLAAFTALGDKLVAQYDSYEVLPGLHINGRLTLGENIGDNGGLQVAHYAYHLSLGGAAAPTLDGLSGDQRFFMGWAQAWRSKYREAFLRNLTISDEHSAPLFRVNGVVCNMDAWYAAFNIEPGGRLYLAPASRVQIW